MKGTINLLATTLLLLILFLSCSSAPRAVEESESSSYSHSNRASDLISGLLEDEKASEALQWIYYYREKDDAPDLDFDALEQQALQTMEGQLSSAM